MANIPKLRSREQILGDLIDAFLARVDGINDLNDGSVLLQFFEAVAQSNFKAMADIIQMIDSQSVDRAVGEQLQRLARDKKVPILSAQASSGKVTITDLSFSKVATTVYAGQPAPVAGSLVVYVTDASKFTPTGKIYISRGTSNAEGPLTYTSVTPQAGGSYWAVNLSATTPTTRFHNIGANVVMAQGGIRTIPSGSTMETDEGAAVTSVKFRTTANATILDGETVVDSVPVVCTEPGVVGNVPRGAIRKAGSLAFETSVYNSNAISNGKAADNDDTLRARIKSYEQAKSKGTEVAIRLAALDVVAPDELKRVQSSSIYRYSDNTSDLIFDDGSIYEPVYKGIGFESIVSSAVGGEKEIQLRRRPVAAARLKNSLEEPYALYGNEQLDIEINGINYSHFFAESDFKVPGSATAAEIVDSINGNSNIEFLASTADGGQYVVLYPKAKESNDIIVKDVLINVNANLTLGFPVGQEYTIRLYKNDKPLYEDGLLAKVSAKQKSLWSPTILPGDTLKYKVDGTPEISVTFTNAAFQKYEITSTVNTLQPAELWQKVFNDLMPGVTANLNGEIFEFVSNLGADSRAQVEITGGTLKDKIFAAGSLSSTGRSSDYTLNKQTGQISLSEPLVPGDSVTAGSRFTRAKVFTAGLSSGPASAGNVWLIVDGDAIAVPNNMEATSKLRFTKTGSKMTIECFKSDGVTPVGFDDTQVGDWLLVWGNSGDPAPIDPTFSVSDPLNAPVSGFWRVESVEKGIVTVDDGSTMRGSNALGTLFTPITDRVVFTRSIAPLQKFSYPIGTLADFVVDAREQISGVDVDVVGATVRIATKTADLNGEIFIITTDNGGKNLDLPVGEKITNIPSHLGFVATADSEAGYPYFRHGTVSSIVDDDQFGIPEYIEAGGTKDDFLEVLDRHNAAAREILHDSNDDRRVFLTNFNAGVVDALPQSFMRSDASPLKANDRYFLRTAYQFDAKDTTTAVIDADVVTQSFTLPVGRSVKINTHSTATIQTFSADDGESSLPLADPASFLNFDFANFKAWRKANTTLTDGTYGIKMKYAEFGPAGDRIRVGIVYPRTSGTDSISHIIDKSDVVDIGLVLPVITPRTPDWDETSSFTVAASTSGGKDTITYTYRIGTPPNFLGSPAVTTGDVAIIDEITSLLESNKGFSAKVTSVSNDSFTIEVPSVGAVSDAMSVLSMLNVAGTTTITFATPHNITPGQRIGFYNTAPVDLSGPQTNRPFDTTYFPDIIDTVTIELDTPAGTPGGLITSGTHVGNLVTLIAPSHGLEAGNVILVQNTGFASYDGLVSVHAVLNVNSFQYIKPGSSSSISGSGRFDFQSYQPGSSVGITTITRNGTYDVTVNTSVAHGYSTGKIADISGSIMEAWSNVTAYGLGRIVSFGGQNYQCISAHTGQMPPNPTYWQPTAFEFNGRHVIQSVTPTSFTFKMDTDGNTATLNGTGGAASSLNPKADLARSLRSAAGLQFGEVSTTAQELVDYVKSNLTDFLEAEMINNGTITTSTEDLDAGANYLSGAITGYSTVNGSRIVRFSVSSLIPKGSTVTVAGMGVTAYNGKFTVLNSTASYFDVFTSVQATTTASVVDAGSYTGSTAFEMLVDGANSVLSTSIAALIGSPQFTVKSPWETTPSVGEEIRLIAVNSDHLTRFWSNLIVTGLSNVATIKNSEYGRQIQVMSNKFGSTSSVQIAGGPANSGQVAIVGSGAVESDKLGYFNIPFKIKTGMNAGHWIEMNNTVLQNKEINLGNLTQLQAHNDGISIVAGPGTFQTQRAVSTSASQIFKVEHHGPFVAIIRESGVSLDLVAAGVKEGDWVRIRNRKSATTWSSLVPYTIGQRIYKDGKQYDALANSTGIDPVGQDWNRTVQYTIGTTVTFGVITYQAVTANIDSRPDVSPSAWTPIWENNEWKTQNLGIFQVVRTFGNDTFYIENTDAIEDLFKLGDALNLSFFSYDSIMPGDTLIINGTILNASNVGRYVVQDDSESPSYSFPTATRIYTTNIPVAVAPTQLGTASNQITIEEESFLKLHKRIFAIGPGPGLLASVFVDTPELMTKISSSAGSFLDMKNKLGFNQFINYGVDGYKYFTGLISELNRVIYGDPTNPEKYPGVRAAGTAINIRPAIAKRITIGVSVRVKTGIPFSEVRDRVKASVAGYVNGLGTGESVAISEIVNAAQAVNGVVAVAITDPVYNSVSDLIAVGADQKAFVADPNTDIVVSFTGNI